MNLRHIAEGYINLLASGTPLANTLIEELAKERLEICNSCPDLNNTDDKCKLKIHNSLKFKCCTHCSCYMEAKTRSLDAKCGNTSNPKW